MKQRERDSPTCSHTYTHPVSQSSYMKVSIKSWCLANPNWHCMLRMLPECLPSGSVDFIFLPFLTQRVTWDTNARFRLWHMIWLLVFYPHMYDLCLWHKPTELAHSFLLCSCVYFCLYGTFNCISFHQFSRQLRSLTLFFRSNWSFQLYVSVWKSPSALI